MSSSLRGRWDHGGGRVCIERCVFCFVAIHSAFFASAFSICSASSALVYLAFYASFPYPPARRLCCMETERASGVEMLLAFRAAVRPFPGAAFVVALALGFPNFLEYLQCYSAVWIRIRAMHQKEHYASLLFIVFLLSCCLQKTFSYILLLFLISTVLVAYYTLTRRTHFSQFFGS